MDDLYTKTLTNVEVILRNFSGNKVSSYTPEGIRTFAVILSDDIASDMETAGWSIKKDNYGTKVIIVTIPKDFSIDGTHMDRGVPLDARFNIELVGYSWAYPSLNRHGIKAYMKSILFTN